MRPTDEEIPSSRADAYAGPEQPTVKRQNPLSESSQRTTTKMKKADIDALVKNEKDASGTRPAVSDEEIADLMAFLSRPPADVAAQPGRSR